MANKTVLCSQDAFSPLQKQMLYCGESPVLKAAEEGSWKN
jgi:hypothetical protein